jgi:hypothetical protein
LSYLLKEKTLEMSRSGSQTRWFQILVIEEVSLE